MNVQRIKNDALYSLTVFIVAFAAALLEDLPKSEPEKKEDDKADGTELFG